MARSHSTQRRVSASSSTRVSAATPSSAARCSMAMAACATAGNQSGADRRERMRSPSPSRSSPAQARMMASYCPASSLARRVFTLPRRSSRCRSGRNARSCAWRRKDEVPTRAPLGRSERCAWALLMKASAASARSNTAPMANPGSSSIGTSFNECTAMSARPSCKATSSSLRNRPLPPISASGRSMIWSPRVVIGTNWMSSPACAARRRAATCSACHRASALWRVAMRSRFTASAPVCATPAGCDD